MLLGCIADDFTGASDLANTLAKGGMTTMQFVGVPADLAPGTCEAGVIALKTRSIAPVEAVAQSLAALEWLRDQGCRQFLFKYCSTFDSTPHGNIGPVAEALLDALDAPVAVVCPVFPATGRTLFMGHLFVGDRLLSESGMETHPLNPMTDADIRRWLSRQCHGQVGLVNHAIVREGAEAVRSALDGEARAGRRLVVVDAIADEDLLTLGAAIAGHRLVTGGSGIAMGLPANFRSEGLLNDLGSGFTPVRGPAAVFSGSCSRATRAQVGHHAKHHPAFHVEPERLMAGEDVLGAAAAFVLANRDSAPIVYSTAEPDMVQQAQARYGRERVAAALESLFGTLAARAVEGGVVRLVVGGGETAGAVVTALRLERFHIGPEIDPGVPTLAAEGAHTLRMALKSGNFGAVDFYAKASEMLGAA